MAEQVTNVSGGAVLFVVFLVLAAAFAANPETRAKIIEILEEAYAKIKCLLISVCAATEDDRTAIDSTKALACAIDATAYWSGRPPDELTNCLNDIKDGTKNFCTSLFKGKDGAWLVGSCSEGTSEPTPTTNAIRASSGSILSKLSEWSGGGNKITGNAVNNRITGMVPATSADCESGFKNSACKDIDGKKYYCNKGTKEYCGKTLLEGGWDGHALCTPSKGCNEIKCSDCGAHGSKNCDRGECDAISDIWATNNKGKCNFGAYADGYGGDTCTLEQSAPQKKQYESTEADKTLRDNPGKSIKFGKTSVVCDKGGVNLKCCKFSSGTTYWYDWKESCTIMGQGSAEEADATNCGPKPTGALAPPLSCQVKAFELPQDVTTGGPDTPWYGKVIGTTLDFGRAWIGAIGEPHYLVYYETFPPEAEEAWMYSGWDVLVTAFATGAVMNLGVGGVKVAATGVKAGGLYTIKNAGLSIKALLGKEVKAAEREALENEFKSAMSARLAKEFGGTALMRFGAAKAVEQNMVIDTVDRAQAEIVKDAIDDTLHIMEHFEKEIGSVSAERYLADLEILVSGEGDITAESVRRILPASKFTDEEVNNAALALNDLRTGLRDGKIVNKGNLMDRTKELYRQKYEGLSEERFKELYAAEFKDTYKKMEVGLGRAVLSSDKEKIGIIPALKWAAKKLGLKSTDPLDKVANEMAMANYERMTSKMISRMDAFESKSVTLGGKEITASTPELSGWLKSSTKIEIDDVAKGIGADASEDEFKAMLTAWLNLEDPVVKTTIWERAGQLVKQFSGTPALDKVPTFKRQAVMATSLALSYVYMMQESKAEKYKVAQNTVMLSRPPMWTFLMKSPDDPGNYNYKNSVKLSALNKDTWVQMKIPGVFSEGGMPLYLASPCKADVSVTWGKCKCKEYGNGDKVLVRFSSRTEITGTPQEVKNTVMGILDFMQPGGGAISCDAKKSYVISLLDKLGLSQNEYIVQFLSCPLKSIALSASGAIENAALSNDEVVALPTREKPFAGSIKDYIGDLAGGEDKSPLTKDMKAMVEKKEQDMTGEIVSKLTRMNAKFTTTFTYEPINLGPSKEGGYVTHKICTEEGWWDFVTSSAAVEYPCIQISVDATSMSNYGKAGFDPNFCRISKGKAEDMAQSGIEAGVLIGGVALTLFPVTTAAGTAVLMGASGGLGAVGSKYIDITSKWPEKQY